MQISPNDGKHNAFPSATRTKNGNLIVVYRKSETHVGRLAVAVSRESKDDGNTWGPENTVLEYPGTDCGPAGIRTLSNGDLLLNGSIWDYITGVNPSDNIITRRSTDNGTTWGPLARVGSVAFNVWDWSGGPVCQISGGRVFLPAYGRSADWDFDATSFLYSDDNGKTWPGEIVVYGNRASNECSIIQLADGRLFACARSEPNGYIMTSFSTDDGRRWSFWKDVVAGNGYPNCIQLPNKTLRLYYRSMDPSSRVEWIESYDGGKKWTVPRIYTNSRYAYSDSVIMPDGRQFFVYATENNSPSPTVSTVQAYFHDPAI